MKPIAIIIAVVVIIGGGAALMFAGKDSNGAESTARSTNDTSKTYTEAEVAQHKTKSDCWTTIKGGVYDLTDYIPRHSGGDEILRACGTDGTSLFEQRTTTDGQKVGTGTPHSGMAQSQLSSLKIGTLSKQ